MSLKSPLFALSAVEPDPIFSSAEKAAKDPSSLINATIGVINDEKGELLVFDSVKKAIAENSPCIPYAPIAGDPEFLSSVKRLVFGEFAENSTAVAGCGGTGSLSVLLHFAFLSGIRKAILPIPTWANHSKVICASGMTVHEVAYLESAAPSFNPLKDMVAKINEPCLLVLQTGCHNPTGLDPSLEQWKDLADYIAGTNHCVLLDFPYQGLGDGVEEDRIPISILRESSVPLLVAWSASKNHCIYGLRTGAALSLTQNINFRDIHQRHLEITSRSIVSTLQISGQRIVAEIQDNHYNEWSDELKNLRSILTEKRRILAEKLPAYSFQILKSRGLFVLIPLPPGAVESIAGNKIFLTPDGRINIAAVPMHKIKTLGSAIAKIIKQ